MEMLENLIDKSLSAVVFIHDYLQFQLDSGFVSFFVFPVVEVGNHVYKIGDNGYRDALCDLIELKIIDVNYLDDEIFTLQFDHAKVYCSLQPYSRIYPETIVVDIDEGTTIVI